MSILPLFGLHDGIGVEGIDVRLASFAAMSDGTKVDAPKALEKAAKRLKR